MEPIVYDEDSIEVKAVIKTKSGVAEASVFWTSDTTSGFSSIPMYFVSGDTAVGYIPAQIDSTEIFYYLSATSNSGRTVTKPLVAPDGFYHFKIDNPVPVELISFTAAKVNDGVRLDWVTASEINNKGFEVERLQDSKIERLKDWKTIGFVKGNGTSTEINSYSFTDKDILKDIIFYRIKQIDLDGTYKIYGPVELKVETPFTFSLEQNYPNPFNPSTKIKFTVPSVIASGAKQSQLVTLKIYDILGNEIATLVNEEKLAGTYEVIFDSHSGNVRNLPSGVYFYRLQAGSYVETKKMLFLK